MRVARSDENTVRNQRHPVLGDKSIPPCGDAKLARKYAHERNREMLSHQDRYADSLRKRLEENS